MGVLVGPPQYQCVYSHRTDMTTDYCSTLAQWCWHSKLPAPVYDREAVVGVENGENVYFMFCLALGIKETGSGRSREEAQQEAARKVLNRLEQKAGLNPKEEVRRSSLDEPVSFLAKFAQDRSFQVSYSEFRDDGIGQFGCLAQLSAGPQVQMGVCYGAGKDQARAREQAARSALSYLRIVSKELVPGRD